MIRAIIGEDAPGVVEPPSILIVIQQPLHPRGLEMGKQLVGTLGAAPVRYIVR